MGRGKKFPKKKNWVSAATVVLRWERMTGRDHRMFASLARRNFSISSAVSPFFVEQGEADGFLSKKKKLTTNENRK
jgi:hypothetical protein